MLSRILASYLIAVVISISQVFANVNDLIDAGQSSYTAGDYAAAKKRFEEAVEMHPKNPNGHYHLANTLVVLKDYEGALSEYERCLQLKPSSQMEGYCREAISKWTQALAEQKSAAESERAENERKKEEEHRSKLEARLLQNAEDKHNELQKQADLRRSEITRQMDMDIQRVKDELAQQIDEAAANSNYRYSWRRGQQTYLPAFVRRGLQDEAGKKMQRIRDEAYRRMNELKVPSVDEILGGMRHYAPGTSQMQLQPGNTNMNLRNYNK